MRERRNWVREQERHSLRTGAHRRSRVCNHGGLGDHGVRDGHDHLIERRKRQKPISMISKIANQVEKG